MTRAGPLLTLLALVLAALGLRLYGLDFLLPHRMEPDAQIVAQVRLLDDPQRYESWQFDAYPLLVARVADLLPGPLERPPEPGMSVEQHRANASAEIVRVRLAVALLSLLAIPATWFLARRALGQGASLFAAALVAVSLLGLSMAQQARPHAAACGIFLLALLACLRLRRSPTFASHILAALFVGLSIGALHSGIALLLPLLAAWFAADKPARLARWAGPAASVAILAALFWLFYPFVFSQAGSIGVDAGTGRFRQGAHFVDTAEFNGKGFARVLWAFWSYEPLTLLLALGGLALAWPLLPRTRAGRRDLFVVLSWAVPYLLVLGIFARTQERFTLPLVPMAAILAAIPLERALRLAPGRTRTVLVACLLASLAFPAWMAWRLSSLRAADDTIELAASWIAEHARPGQDRVLVMPPLDLPLFNGDEALAANSRLIPEGDVYPRITHWWRYQKRAQAVVRPADRHELLLVPLPELRPGADRVALLAEMDARWHVVELFPPARGEWRSQRIGYFMRAGRRPVARFSPWREGVASELQFEYEGLPPHPEAHFVGYILRSERLGPVIEIWDREWP